MGRPGCGGGQQGKMWQEEDVKDVSSILCSACFASLGDSACSGYPETKLWFQDFFEENQQPGCLEAKNWRNSAPCGFAEECPMCERQESIWEDPYMQGTN